MQMPLSVFIMTVLKINSVRGLTTYFYHPWQKELAVNIHSAVMIKQI